MKLLHIELALCAFATALLGACGGGSSSSPTPAGARPSAAAYAPAIDPAQFTDQITNRYFPLIPGTTYVYEGAKDGEPTRNEVTVIRESKTITGVRCVVVHDVVTQGGELVEETYDWYAQDSAGNVWYFGEDSKEYEGGKVTSTAGSWEAGVDGAQPGIVMKAAPKVGDTYRQEYYPGEAEDMAKILNVSDTVEVPAGSYGDVVVTEDFTPLDPDIVEHKYFAPGVGFVKGAMVKGGKEETHLVQTATN